MTRLGIASAAILLVACRSGDAVGKVDAMKATSVEVELAAGDMLEFRVDADGEVGPPHDHWKRNRAIEFLQRSQVAVRVVGPSGETSARCPMRGNGWTEGMSGPKLYTKGLNVSCEIAVTQSGKHQVSATVDWDPAIIKPLSAVVEVRRVKP